MKFLRGSGGNMKSLAVWYERQMEDQEPSQLDVHFNYWKMRPKKKLFRSAEAPMRTLDVGLMIQNSNLVDTFCIFLPVAKDKVEVKCLGETISDDPQLFNAIFNEHYQIQKADQARSFQVKNSHNENLFHLVIKPDAIEKEDVGDENGCLVKISLGQVSVGKAYLRLRFTGDFLMDFSTEEQCSNSILNSAFNRMEIFDFRLNSTRHLPLEVIEKMDAAARFKLKKAHFFLICSYKENFVLSHTPYLSARRLEKGVWDNYIDLNIKESILAYQWTKKSQGEDGLDAFGVLTKTSYRYNNWQTILRYAVVALVFSVVAGIAANTVFYNFTNSNNQQSEETIDDDREEYLEGGLVADKAEVRKPDTVGKQDR
jgi:hypothetical protein